MFVDKDSIKVNGLDFGQYLVEAKFGYHKLWSKDSGRNIGGSQTGTLTGIYPKIIMQFRSLTKDELQIVAPILDSANQTVNYYDPVKEAQTDMATYTGDWAVVNRSINKNLGFQCSFISTKRRA